MLHIEKRPKTFDEVKGNEELICSLKSLLKRKNRSHTYLFYGPPGCGKTTMARIFSNELGCNEWDLKELNCADFRGIDSAREIIQQMRLSPMNSPVRCWIIDECHMLTKEAQNALLKAFEEPPDHVYFFLCTTNPEKLLPTVKSRCVPCQVKKLKQEILIELLKSFEFKNVPDELYEQIAFFSEGQPRRALIQLDMINNMPSKAIKKELLDIDTEKSLSIDLCRLLMKKNTWDKAREILKGLIDEDAESIRRHILAYCSTALLNGNEKAASIMGYFIEPFYESGKYGLYLAVYDSIKGN